MRNDSKIYISGHNGLVGSAILRILKAQGYTNLVYRSKAELNLLDQHAVQVFFELEKPEYVFLAAAKVGGIHANNTYRADFIYENLQIQNNIIHNSYLSQVKKLLFLGSSCIYPKNCPQPIKEDYLLTDELEYTNEPYAIAKIAGIKMCESYNLQYGTNFISIMPTNLYGPNDNFDLENSHVLPAMIRKMYLAKLLLLKCYDEIARNLKCNNNKDEIELLLSKYGICKNSHNVILKLWGSGRPCREFLHVNDMADAAVFIMQNISFTDLYSDNEVKNTHINIGTGKDITIKDLAYMVKDKLDFAGIIDFDSSKPDGTPKKLLDVSKISTLGWSNKINLEDGVRDLINWYINYS